MRNIFQVLGQKKQYVYNVIAEAICRSVANAVPHADIQRIDGDTLYDFTSTFHISHCNPWNSKMG